MNEAARKDEIPQPDDSQSRGEEKNQSHSPVIEPSLELNSQPSAAGAEEATPQVIDLTQPRGTAEHPSGIDITTQQIPLSEEGTVRSAFRIARIGENSRVVVSVPAGRVNRFWNANGALHLAHLLLRDTPVAHVRLRVCIDDEEMHQAGLAFEGFGRSEAAEQYPQFLEFFALAVQQRSDRYSVEAFIQPASTSSIEAKLAMRECHMLDGATHLIFPTHSGPLMTRLTLAARNEALRIADKAWTEALGLVEAHLDPSSLEGSGSEDSQEESDESPDEAKPSSGLQVIIWDHHDDFNIPTSTAESLSLVVAEVIERHFPDHMDRLGLKRGRAGKLYGLAQKGKVNLLQMLNRS